jgi:hypothetical protein
MKTKPSFWKIFLFTLSLIEFISWSPGTIGTPLEKLLFLIIENVKFSKPISHSVIYFNPAMMLLIYINSSKHIVEIIKTYVYQYIPTPILIKMERNRKSLITILLLVGFFIVLSVIIILNLNTLLNNLDINLLFNSIYCNKLLIGIVFITILIVRIINGLHDEIRTITR